MRELDPSDYLYERYPGSERRSGLLKLYYLVKPALPRRLQLAMRRAYAPRQARREFPAWPFEPLLVDHHHARLRRRIEDSGDGSAAFVNYWPEGRRFAAILTHDVEGPTGVRNIRRVREVERRHGFVSSWNFVAEDYPIPDGLFDELRAEGCEIGLHGVTHDGKLFQDRAHFDADLPKIHGYLRDWEAVGFRSPATHRNADWMPELGSLYDSSFPDTDPFEPQSGGCCSIWPFFIGDLVELPITLVQDHTLWEILRDRSIDRWVEKSRWVAERHGLIHLIVHPDYVVHPESLALYEAFLEWLAAQEAGWFALPREVAEWWCEREQLSLGGSEGSEAVSGPGAARASVARASEAGGRLVIETGA